MPLPLETTPITANALFVPNITLQTSIVDGAIRTSAHITLRGAKVSEHGIWSDADSQTRSVYIPNIFALEADIAQFSEQAAVLFAGMVGIVGSINSIRKVL